MAKNEKLNEEGATNNNLTSTTYEKSKHIKLNQNKGNKKK